MVKYPLAPTAQRLGRSAWMWTVRTQTLLFPASDFVSAARERILWLENIIRERLPDIDLRSGPQVDPSSDPTAPSQDERIPEDADITISSIPPVPTVSRKRSAEASGQSDQDESFPESAHSVAVNLGMLSLNIDSPQKHYLGSSSGLLFTNLIGASPPSVESTSQCPQGDKYAGELEWSDDAVAQDQNRKYHQELYNLLKQELPSKHNALVLIHTYIRWIHPDFPFLEPLSLFSAVEAIYSFLRAFWNAMSPPMVGPLICRRFDGMEEW
ncbi:hypothetical protein FVER53590_25032 [Fusarium verticillioides]|nr:hypothetical protein FVER53590_25032 [Fusarium verticillioides]